MDRAMSRIETALARIEKAAQELASDRTAGGERDGALRTRVQSALEELDGLITELDK